VPSKVLATLLVLVEAEGKVVSKTELLDRVWPDTYVEENNLTQNISALRKLLAADFPDERPIATLARIGYRFQLPVRVLDEASVPGQAALQIVAPTLQEVPAPDTAMSAAFSVPSDTQVILGHEDGHRSETAALLRALRLACRTGAATNCRDWPGSEGNDWS
jgi:DNA-binding winged helix-turn-helix (wHTH) protein